MLNVSNGNSFINNSYINFQSPINKKKNFAYSKRADSFSFTGKEKIITDFEKAVREGLSGAYIEVKNKKNIKTNLVKGKISKKTIETKTQKIVEKYDENETLVGKDIYKNKIIHKSWFLDDIGTIHNIEYKKGKKFSEIEDTPDENSLCKVFYNSKEKENYAFVRSKVNNKILERINFLYTTNGKLNQTITKRIDGSEEILFYDAKGENFTHSINIFKDKSSFEEFFDGTDINNIIKIKYKSDNLIILSKTEKLEDSGHIIVAEHPNGLRLIDDYDSYLALKSETMEYKDYKLTTFYNDNFKPTHGLFINPQGNIINLKFKDNYIESMVDSKGNELSQKIDKIEKWQDNLEEMVEDIKKAANKAYEIENKLTWGYFEDFENEIVAKNIPPTNPPPYLKTIWDKKEIFEKSKDTASKLVSLKTKLIEICEDFINRKNHDFN